MPDGSVIDKKSTWDELFGGSSSVDSTVLQRTPATTMASEVDRADNWLDMTTPAFATNHHGDHTTSTDHFDATTMFDDAFLDGIVGVNRDRKNDVWDSLTTGRNAAAVDAMSYSRSRSPFDDVAAFPVQTATSSSTSLRTAGADERARPRPRPQAAAAVGDNPFTATLQAATAAARYAVDELVYCLWFCSFYC